LDGAQGEGSNEKRQGGKALKRGAKEMETATRSMRGFPTYSRG